MEKMYVSFDENNKENSCHYEESLNIITFKSYEAPVDFDYKVDYCKLVDGKVVVMKGQREERNKEEAEEQKAEQEVLDAYDEAFKEDDERDKAELKRLVKALTVEVEALKNPEKVSLLNKVFGKK